jgi:SAM-dependent methyltransferase
MTHREATRFLDNPALRNFNSSSHGGAANHAPVAVAPVPVHWADLGCGSGAFTLALAEFLPPGSTIQAIDLTPGIKKQITRNKVTILPQVADITQPNPALENLDGVLIANAIHYIRDRPGFILLLHSILKPGGILCLIEYDTDSPVPRWVPYPLSFNSASRLFVPPKWAELQKGNTRPSAFGRTYLYLAITQKIITIDKSSL